MRTSLAQHPAVLDIPLVDTSEFTVNGKIQALSFLIHVSVYPVLGSVADVLLASANAISASFSRITLLFSSSLSRLSSMMAFSSSYSMKYNIRNKKENYTSVITAG